MAYMMAARLIPGAFAFSAEPGAGHSMDGSNALYYSFVTLTTMGMATSSRSRALARVLAIMEATTSVLYMSVLIARLVGMYSTVTPIQDESDSNGSSKRLID